ncbi:hypothetical protein [Desulfovibrio fairfieldensis]|uniref:Uncharacterized protein n=1 Tax=Desulfovibrio fairfieldensis TaxID=44742 RepID=A0A120KMY7_9BACT|nr:hypothetical protein [Desulfovibrio fairfieldensis]AMD89464.1 hypothetical protein AXF13_04685 [Desulfovibrio fairfieldensis]
MKSWEFEDAFWETEGIQIVIRAPRNEDVPDYSYERACSGNTTLAELRRGRLAALGEEFEYEIIDGDNETPNGKTKLSTIRDSYD